ncbi:MAG: polysaccharide deacetylase family protein [Firmicutes bacterium]|nr:polysaccharide deacetylase family protein [Bacillota bacterium]
MKKPLFFLIISLLLIILFTVQAITLAKNPGYPEPVFQVEKTKGFLFLTFNLPWGESQLDTLLRILDEHDSRAVFFISGHWLKEYPQNAKKIINGGHQIGNHTFSYARLLALKEEEIEQEISSFNKLCEETCNINPVFFRPPYGEYNPRIVRLASENGCFTLLWSINALMLSNLETELIINHIEERIHDGAVILLHATPRIVETLPQIINFLEWKGYTIASPDLIKEYAEKRCNYSELATR